MRKFVVLFVSLVFSTSIASAAPAYGTKMPEKGKSKPNTYSPYNMLPSS